MNETTTATERALANDPPLRPEDWWAFVVAAQAYRARSEQQQAFGKSLMERYMVELPKRLERDETASRYLDAMLCHVSAAIRGMSVAATAFGTRWAALEKVQAANVEAIGRLQRFGPLSSESYWVKAVNLLPGGAIAALALTSVQGVAQRFDARFWVVVAGGGVVGMLAVQGFIEVLVFTRSKGIAKSTPDEVDATWQEKTFADYVAIGRQFLRQAYEVTGRFYGEDRWAAPSDDELDELARRQFALLKAQEARPRDHAGV